MMIPVMDMREQKGVLRLKSSDKIGQRHIIIERETVSTEPRHWHDYFEIGVIVEGSGIHCINEVRFPMEKGDVYFLTPVDFHKVESESGMELINISFDEVWMSETMKTYLYSSKLTSVKKFSQEWQGPFHMATELLLREYEADGPCVGQLLEYLLSRFMVKEADSRTNQEHLSGINAAIAYMEMHFREKITLEQLAKLSGYTPTYFSQLFRQTMGKTYIERLTYLRFNYARILLESGFSVTDACFNSGFGSLSNFNSVFKEQCGMSPSEYRKKYK